MFDGPLHPDRTWPGPGRLSAITTTPSCPGERSRQAWPHSAYTGLYLLLGLEYLTPDQSGVYEILRKMKKNYKKKKPNKSWRAGLKENSASAFMHAEANIRVCTHTINT